MFLFQIELAFQDVIDIKVPSNPYHLFTYHVCPVFQAKIVSQSGSLLHNTTGVVM